MKILATLMAAASIALPSLAAQHDWENNHVLQINREPARAAFMPYHTTPGDRQLSLNGTWQFRWAPTPDKISAAAWTTLAVPANWEVNGFGTPIYSSSGYTFKVNPPYVMDEPKQNYTAYTERNPTGQYRRTFTLPAGWSADGGVTYLRFDGVMSAFYVTVNGTRVGYSQGSNSPSEFNITKYLKAGENTIELEVYKYSDGSYLEDQDAWRFGGIHRDVTLFHTPALHLRDFTVRTIAADDTYRNFRLQVNPKLVAPAGMDGKGYKVIATLYDADGKQVARMEHDAEDILNVNHKAAVMNEWFPQRGRSKFERMDTLLTDIHPWTAETPYLYDLVIQVLNEQSENNSKSNSSLSTLHSSLASSARVRVGFRQLDIKDGMFLVNGKQVRFRGVNRVEHDPFTAHVLTRDRMLQDIRLMKAANINAVRTSHYPSNPEWYDLCDSLGLYILDEADCENHGVRGEFTSTPDWNDAMMDRCIRLAERDKNHPSVVFWSLGNESGFGANHSAMAGWLHEFDPTRFVHYEGAQGPDGNDPKCVDVISRFYPRVMQEYLNPGMPEGSDKERAENARWEHLLQLARNSDPRPVLTSEYAHCMGNALGNFQEYWDEIYSNHRMLGGFIWDWVDQGIVQMENGKWKTENGKSNVGDNSPFSILHSPFVKYGGDFNDRPNLKAFCLNGVVKCDRELTAKYYEVQHVYSPVQFSRHGDAVYVINRNHHTTLADYQLQGKVTVNGKAGKPFAITIPDVQPGDSAVLDISAKYLAVKPGKHTLLNLLVTCNGNTVSEEQFELSGNVMTFVRMENGKRKMENGSSSVALKNIPLGGLGGNFFRAPTDNDKSFGNWVAKDWTKNRIDSPMVVRIDDRTEEYKFVSGSIIVTTTMTPMSDGSIDLVQEYECRGELPEIPRMGVQLQLPKDYENLQYYGRGPWDTYPDRWRSCHIGLWNSTVTAEYAHYPVPQDCGNHRETSMVQLRSKAGKTIRVTAVDEPFSFSALHYTPQDIASVRHDYELKEGDYTILSIDCAVLGIGNSSCGPGVLKKYSIDKSKKHRLHVNIRPS